jgi:protein-L-isoaspartate(D-aspartate) O-methyltransferase
MVERHIAMRGVRDPKVLDAMRSVPRERFVDPGMEEFAYEDSPLPIGERQTISQPYIVALMAEAAELHAGDQALEVGTGSGYAAAVFARVAGEVYTIERHASLASMAQERFDALGYGNIHVLVGDGTRGWPEHAPFDAIMVAAGAPAPPPALQEQLAIGGRLVIPVGDPAFGQRLHKIVREGPERYTHEDLGGVTFVPLIGEQGWAAPDEPAARAPPASGLPARIAEAAIALPDPDDDTFADAFERYADSRIVLLGECSHGTSEFYRARAAISRRLVERHGFDFIAVEADWPDAASIHRHIRGEAEPPDAEPPFQRFPRWMWRNAEFAAFVDWMRGHNAGRASPDALGFHGLDIYNLRGAIAAVLAYLDNTDPEAAAVARERYGCLTPWQKDPATYGRAVLTQRYRDCEAAVVEQCREMLQRHLAAMDGDGDRLLDAAHSARLVASAERYYRTMYYGGAESWNLRDSHMFETLSLLLQAHGPDSTAIVWAHNSHIGDARHTDMGAARGEHNLGQLCRQRFGSAVSLVGFGTDRGTVAAAHVWDDECAVLDVRPSRDDSSERLCHDSGIPRFLLDLRGGIDRTLRRDLGRERLQRFIGVVYRPDTELQSHYAGASLSEQFDAYAWFDRTHAVVPLGDQHPLPGRVPDTYPTGL